MARTRNAIRIQHGDYCGIFADGRKNWTHIQTLQHSALKLLVTLWLSARVIWVAAPQYPHIIALIDLSFNLFLAWSIIAPLIQAKQWRQIGVVAKISLLIIGNTLFYAGAMGYYPEGIGLSNTIALYLIISLILVIGRRVVPMFIERGLSLAAPLKQNKWIDRTIMASLVCLLFNTLFFNDAWLQSSVAFVLYCCHTYRLYHWHHPKLWKKPLLWSLYTGLWLINLGFLALSLNIIFNSISMMMPLHFWAIGGIGLMTIAMMARVSLGHTGRDIHQPPVTLSITLSSLIACVCFRVGMPWLLPEFYQAWIILAYIAWTIAFTTFLISYISILCRPRIDGKAG